MNREEPIHNAQAKYDLIGGLYCSSLFERLGLDVLEHLNKDERIAFKKLENISKHAGEKSGEIIELALEYGNEREEDGFRMGFHVAMRMCMEGLSRP